MANDKRNIPTVLVIFGATGDLMVKKITPALYNLYTKKKLPQMLRIIGFSRRSISQEDFQKHVHDILKKHQGVVYNEKHTEEFIRKIQYQQGDFNSREAYDDLAKVLGRIDGEWKVCSNKLFYLAVPPEYYKRIFEYLASSGLTIPCSPEEGWTRVIVEKPFGRDAQTAEDLDMLLSKLFKEEQIYRIDHYLAKEMLQNILTFRFSNNLLEPSWNNKFIEKIEIKLLETLGVEGRGRFYDGVGALRDVGQNHLLQMLALVTMDHPRTFDVDVIRKTRAELLETLTPPTEKEIVENTFRAQYEGYNKIEGVAKNSKTETYFKLKGFLGSGRWSGVPILFESGKKFPDAKKEIVITFKHPTPCLCPPDAKHHFQNKIIFSLEPKEEIIVNFYSKKPGLEMAVEERDMKFVYRQKKEKTQYVEEYEKLLLDCILGNQLLFLSTREVAAMWRFIDPVVCAWDENKVPLAHYKPDTIAVTEEASQKIEKVEASTLPKEIGVVGLGKMGSGVARQLLEKGWKVVGYNRSPEDTKKLAEDGLTPAYSLEEMVSTLQAPRVIWIMVPAGKAVDETLFGEQGLVKCLEQGDIVIDAGNSLYKESMERAKKLESHGIAFIDVGFSGGPAGARYGGCLMVGGDQKAFEYLRSLFLDLSLPQGIEFFPGSGAGHFTKMIHNGIEYGMMQAIGEGFEILKKAQFNLDLAKVADVYNHGSVIESRLVGWLEDALKIYGHDLKDISSTVGHTGEGAWTVDAARELGVKAKVIEEALEFRKASEKNPSYTGKVLSALRNMFGGHSVK